MLAGLVEEPCPCCSLAREAHPGWLMAPSAIANASPFDIYPPTTRLRLIVSDAFPVPSIWDINSIAPARSALDMKQDFLSCYGRLAVLCSPTAVIVLATPPSLTDSTCSTIR